MWQVCRRSKEAGRPVQVNILDALWPEFGFNHLIPIVLKYQTTRKEAVIKLDPLLERDISELKEWRRLRKLEYLNEIIQ